jgi:hypothetical protein
MYLKLFRDIFGTEIMKQIILHKPVVAELVKKFSVSHMESNNYLQSCSSITRCDTV